MAEAVLPGWFVALYVSAQHGSRQENKGLRMKSMPGYPASARLSASVIGQGRFTKSSQASP